MKIHVGAANTLMLHGPLSCTLIEGEGFCLGAQVEARTPLAVRRFRALPVYCAQNSQFEVLLGYGAFLHKVEGSTIPSEWVHVADALAAAATSMPIVVVVVGGVDVGKTSLTTFLANSAFLRGIRVGVVDGDVGQSDIGPPTTVGSLIVTHPIFDLASELPDDLRFVGVTSPAKAKSRMIDELQAASAAMRSEANLILINTDGWIDGEEAVEYKVKLIKATHANAVVAVQRQSELNALMAEAASMGLLTMSAGCSPLVRERAREERKALREQSYMKWLRSSRLRPLSLRHVGVRGQPSWDKGRLIGLFNPAGRFVQIATVENADLDRRLLRVRTNSLADIAFIECSEVLLQNGREALNRPDSS